MTIAEFLLARIAEDEADAARFCKIVTFRASDGHLSIGQESLTARVLAECEVKRRIVDRYENTVFDDWAQPDREYQNWVLPLLALPYANHPDYREEWRP